MIRPEGASQINPYATSTLPTKENPEAIPTSAVLTAPVVEDELSLKIDQMLEDLVFTLAKDAHDDASRRKAIAELHKLRDRKHRRAMDLEKLKIHQRRMDLQESEHQRRREELELKKQQ